MEWLKKIWTWLKPKQAQKEKFSSLKENKPDHLRIDEETDKLLIKYIYAHTCKINDIPCEDKEEKVLEEARAKLSKEELEMLMKIITKCNESK